MGGGTHTKQSNVPKNPRNYSSDEVAVSGGGAGGFDRSAAGACLISFKVKLILELGTSVGAKFVLVPGADSSAGLQLISRGRLIGEYAGNNLDLLKQCIAGGYTYAGTVDKVQPTKGGVTADCTIKGAGPA